MSGAATATLDLAAPADGRLQADAVHWLPCTLDYSGPARVSTFFDPHVKEAEEVEGRRMLSGSFRGRGLSGTQLALPSGHEGHVLQPAPGVDSGDDRARWTSAASFPGFVYWNHEARPLDTDAQQRLMEWLPLAEQMHAPISPEEVSKRLAESAAECATV
eukprot:jgi/Tetstr1/430858/TSEL_002000.t1